MPQGKFRPEGKMTGLGMYTCVGLSRCGRGRGRCVNNLRRIYMNEVPLLPLPPASLTDDVIAKRQSLDIRDMASCHAAGRCWRL